MLEVHISKHSLFFIALTLSRSRSVVWCVVWCVCVVCCVLCVCMWRVWCVGCVYMWCWWCVCVVLLWWCVCVVCGEAWHTLSLFLSLLPLLFPLLFPFPFLFLFFFSLSSLLATKHYGKNRSTNTADNIEAFECDLAQGKCTAVGSLPPPLPSPPPFSPSPPQKRGNFLLQEYFRRGIYFLLQF